MAFPFKEYEARWRAHWQDHDTFRLSDDIDSSRPKFYVLDSGPFSAFGELDAVHIRGRVAADVVARFKRMRGYSVLFPVGWDSFRLPPREQSAAAAHPPRDAAQRRMARARRRLDVLGISYDFAREVVAHDPATIRWTQRLFALFYERGLIGQETASVWWHPELGVSLPEGELAEEVADPLGHGWIRRQTRAWVVSMHGHAERLLGGLHGLCWPAKVVGNQRHLIGRSEGWYIDFQVAGNPERSIRVFTSRPDAIFGASYLVLSPEHAVVDELTTELRRPLVDGYRSQAAARQEHESGAAHPETPGELTGVFTGCYAVNPATSETIPVWVSDHVPAGYGTGALMGIPGQDEHDWEFAETFELPIIRTVEPPAGFAGRAYTGDGMIINSGFLDGLSVAEAKQAIEAWLSSRGLGGYEIVSRLHPWVFSRYSTWGEPIPVYYMMTHGEDAHLVPDEELPVLLPGPGPYSRSDEPVSPLAHSTGWTDIVDPATGKLGVRESATMSQWASACWRHLRHIDPDNTSAPVDPERERHFMPVDLYLCDPEYASRYLLYARFWHQALFDAGLSSVEEPFARVVCPGAVFMEPEDQPEDEPEAETEPASADMPAGTVPVDGDVITDALRRYGADTVRLYLLFLGPLEQPKAWDAHALEGPHRFLHRVARSILGEDGRGEDVQGEDRSTSRVTDAQPTAEQWRALESMLASVTEHTEALRFHTAISALMAFAHDASRWPELPRSIAEPFILALGPYAPHLAEEAWQHLGHTRSLAHARWPELPRADHAGSHESLE